MDPAKTMAAAAHRLRELAEAAGSGPWKAIPDVMIGGWAVAHESADAGGPYLADFTRAEHAYWIAMMHPGVGLALADWLDATAGEMTAANGTEYAYSEFASWTAALALARQILGEVA